MVKEEKERDLESRREGMIFGYNLSIVTLYIIAIGTIISCGIILSDHRKVPSLNLANQLCGLTLISDENLLKNGNK